MADVSTQGDAIDDLSEAVRTISVQDGPQDELATAGEAGEGSGAGADPSSVELAFDAHSRPPGAPSRPAPSSSAPKMDSRDLFAKSCILPRFDQRRAAEADLLRFSEVGGESAVLGANLDAIHAGGWKEAVLARWGLTKETARPLPAELAQQVGEQISWDDPKRKDLLKWVAFGAAIMARGEGRDVLACVVSGPRGTGKTSMFEALAAGAMLSCPPPSDDGGHTIYCGVLKRPVFLMSGKDESDPVFTSLPVATETPSGNAIPMSMVLIGLEVLRMHGVRDLPGGGIHELKSAKTKNPWAVWDEQAYEAYAFGLLSDWLRDRKMGLVLFLDEWQLNFNSAVKPLYRLLFINQLAVSSYIGRGDRVFFQLVLGGSSSAIGPSLQYTGPLVGRGEPHLRTPKNIDIAVPEGRRAMHPDRLRVVHLTGVQTLEQLERLLAAYTRAHPPPAGVAGLLEELSEENDTEKRLELIRNRVVTMANNEEMSLGDVLERMGGNCRAMLRVIFGAPGSDAVVVEPGVRALKLTSQPQLTSLYWAMALELWHTRREFVEGVARDPAKIDGSGLIVLKYKLVPALRRLRVLLRQLEHSDDTIEKVLQVETELERQQLLYSWSNSGYIIVHNGEQINRSLPPPILQLQFPSAAHLRAVIAGIASEKGTPLALRYIETIQRPEGNHARREGEFMVFAALGGRAGPGVRQTNLGTAALQHLAVSSADTVPAQEKVLRALMEEDDCLPAQTNGWRYAQALCRRLGREGMLLLASPSAEEGDRAGDDAALGDGSGSGQEATRGAAADTLPSGIARRVEATVQSLRPGGSGKATRQQRRAMALASRQAVMRAVLAAALEDFPSAYSTEDEGSRWSKEPSPFTWNPEDGTAEVKLGVLYKRGGADSGVDGIGAARLPAGVLAVFAFQIKLTAETSKMPLAPGVLRDVAIHVHFDMAKSGIVGKLVRKFDAQGVIPVLVLASNREVSSVLRAPAPAHTWSGGVPRAGMGAAGAPPGGIAVEGRAGAAGEAEADGPDGGEPTSIPGWNVAAAAQQRSAGGDATAFDWVTKPDEGVVAFSARYLDGGSDATSSQFVPRGGAAMVLARSELNRMWPAPIRLLANEHNVSCFGGHMPTEERAELERAAWPARTQGSVFEMYSHLVSEEQRRLEDNLEREKRERKRREEERKLEEEGQERELARRKLENEKQQRKLALEKEKQERELELEKEKQQRELARRKLENEKQQRELARQQRQLQLEARKQERELNEEEERERRRVDLASRLSLQTSHPLIDFLLGMGCTWESLLAMDEGALSDLGDAVAGTDQPVATKNIIRTAWWMARRRILSPREAGAAK